MKAKSLSFWVYVQLCLLVLLPLAFFPPWVGLPFSGNLSGLGYVGGAVMFSRSLLPFGGLFLLALLLLAGAIFFDKKLPAVVLAAICLSFVLQILAFLVSVDVTTLPYYVQDVEDFKTLKHYFGAYFIPNKGGSLGLPIDSPLDSVSGRMLLGMDVLGWGWFLALGICVGLLAFAVARAGAKTLMLALPVALAPSLLFLYAPIKAAEMRRDAQVQFTDGNYPVAFKYMLTAFRLDPLLIYSQSSTDLFSQLHAVTYGELRPSAVLYVAGRLESKGQRLKIIKMFEQAMLDKANDENFKYVEYQVKRRLLSYSVDMVGKFHRAENWNEALVLLRRVQFFYPENAVADVLTTLSFIRQNAPESCVAATEEAMRKILKSSVIADILATRGECQLMMGANAMARDSFSRSLEIDNERNLRAVRGLSGT